jgi:uncharacterized membrane protein
MRYWLTKGDGQVLGPFELDDLRGQVSRGGLDPTTAMLCLEGGSDWVAATQVLPQPSIQPAAPTQATVAAPADPRLVGIRGWLILPAIGLVLGSIIGFFALFASLGMFKELSRGGYGGLIAFELICSFGLLAFHIYTAVQFFLKKRAVPKLMIAYYCVALAISLLQVVVAIGAGTPAYAVGTARQLVSQVVGAAVWVPYFLVSKRVKATFVK